MKRLERAAVITALIESLDERGSWCGETHVQKTTYLLQELLGSGLGFEFVLYRHGPFSFDLRDELTAMRADLLLEVVPRPRPYGPSLAVTDSGRRLREWYPKTVAKYQRNIDFTADALGGKGAAELERLATARWVTAREELENGVEYRAQRLRELKPYVSVEEALAAIRELDALAAEAASLAAASMTHA